MLISIYVLISRCIKENIISVVIIFPYLIIPYTIKISYPCTRNRKNNNILFIKSNGKNNLQLDFVIVLDTVTFDTATFPFIISGNATTKDFEKR